jgi:hypothetical protein
MPTAKLGPAVVLNSPEDWDQWYDLIWIEARTPEVRSLIDPDAEDSTLEKPLKPRWESGMDRDLYDVQWNEYREDLRQYEETLRRMGDVDSLIVNSVSRRLYSLISSHQRTTQQKLRILKDKLAPTDLIRSNEMILKYRALGRPSRNENVQNWLDNWTQVVWDCQSLGLLEGENSRALTDFLLVLDDIHPSFADRWRYKHEKKGTVTFDEVARQFRQNYANRISNSKLSTFTATFQGEEVDKTPSPKQNGSEKGGKPKEFKWTCLCGIKHPFKDCPYVVEAKRPEDWKPDEKVEEKFRKEMKRNTPARKSIERTLKNEKNPTNFGAKSSEDSNLSESKKTIMTLTTIVPRTPSTFSASSTPTIYTPASMPHSPIGSVNSASFSYPLENSFILDSGATVHICNSQARFANLRPPRIPKETILAGSSLLSVEGYGEVDIRLNGKGSKEIGVLQNVCLVPGLKTNIISIQALIPRGFTFQIGPNQTAILMKNGSEFLYGEYREGQYVAEYNPPGSSSSGKDGAFAVADSAEETHSPPSISDPPPSISGTPPIEKGLAETSDAKIGPQKQDPSPDFERWHRRMGHIGVEPLKRLPTAAGGVNMSNIAIKQPCEICQLSRGYKQISRKPRERAVEPYERVHIDIMQFDTGFNGHQWGIHLYDDAVATHKTHTFSFKSEIFLAVKGFIESVENQYGVRVKIIKFDEERSLGKNFDNWTLERGFEVEYAAPYTPEQNGAIERAGRILSERARALRIDAQLPHELWPEAFRTAAYLTDRTPVRKLGWKTPYESRSEILAKISSAKGLESSPKKPDLSHLRVYGCKAYVRIPNIPKKLKLDPRTHIGFLVGYDSTNIFRIWVPHLKRIIRSRDVVFDEDSGYNPKEPHHSYDLRQQVDEVVELINLPEPEGVREDVWDWEGNPKKSHIPAPKGPKSVSFNPVDDLIGLPTPHQTPEPQEVASLAEETPNDQLAQELAQGIEPDQVQESAPPRESAQSQELAQSPSDSELLSVDLEPSHVRESSRRRRPPRDYGDYVSYHADSLERGYAHKEALATVDHFSGFHSAFSAGLVYRPVRQDTHREDLKPPPKNWAQLKGHPHEREFKEAARKELTDLVRKGTFKQVNRLDKSEVTTLPLLWVFTYKFNNDGYLVKHKARLCVQGNYEPRDSHDNRAATLAIRLFRLLMALVAAFDLETRSLDAVNAFTNSKLDENIYCPAAGGFKDFGISSPFILLQRALYGLRRSPLLWLKELTSGLRKEGFKPLSEHPCLFSNDRVIVFFYVDDIVLLSRKEDKEELNKITARLMRRYEIRDQGELTWFLGIRILRDRPNRKLWLCQDSYIGKIVNSFHLEHAPKAPTPLSTEELNHRTESQATAKEIYTYQRKIGSNLYPGTITRPDIAQASSQLAEFLQNPSQRHVAEADRETCYLRDTKYLALCYSGHTKEVLRIASDAAYGDDKRTRRSTQGYVVSLFGGPIDWKSNKQRIVTTSTTEAELMALTFAAKELYAWLRLFKQLNFDLGVKPVIQCDNKQTVGLLTKEDPQLTSKLRHIAINTLWLRQEVQAGRLDVRWVPTTEMPADGLTKPLTRQKHEEFIRQLGLEDISHLVERR